jgi:succinoglycan biosynthesis protein ExoM
MTEFIIAVCSSRRPLMLRSCLESLTRLQTRPDWRVRIVVVENDSTSRSAGVVDDIRRQTGMEIHYKLEPRIGIPFARNAAMDLASSLEPDWIALIDDDETAHPDWLLRLHDACVRFDADVAAGPVRSICEVAVPAWWRPGRTRNEPTGTPLQGAPTSNILMRACLMCRVPP